MTTVNTPTPNAPNTTFVLVPGSFATPALDDKLVDLLKAKDQTVITIPLLTANDGSRIPPATFDDDVDHIRAAMLSILDSEKRNVILRLHSYSGFPGTSALKGLSKSDRTAAGHDTAVLGIVYIGSFLPVVGESLRNVMGEHLAEPFKTGIQGDYLPAIPADFGSYIFNDVEDQDQVAKYLGSMTRHASDSYSGTCSYAAWKDIPSVQIIPEKDVILPVEVQEKMYKRAKAEGGLVRRVFVEGAGHCINVSRPEIVAEELVKLGKT